MEQSFLKLSQIIISRTIWNYAYRPEKRDEIGQNYD